MHSSTLLACAGLAQLGLAAYSIQDDYSTGFFDKFKYFTGADPTNGTVNYVDQSTAQSKGYTATQNGGFYIGVDHQNTLSGNTGRDSVRLQSTANYKHGLFILDLAHMPASTCGTWPAFWLVGNDGQGWPNTGEIDIIENVNDATFNEMTLHTKDGCSINQNPSSMSSGSKVASTDCYAYANGNQGCSIHASDSKTYGDGFNSAGGGVYATEWTAQGINIWFFSKGSVPSDIGSGSPNPSGWGSPLSSFQGITGVDSYFQDMNIIFDITFCGQWAGAAWGQSATCAQKSSSCVSYVQDSPSDFKDSYWQVNSLKVYQDGGASSQPATNTNTISVAPTTSATVVVPTPTTLIQKAAAVSPPQGAPSPLTDSEFGQGSLGIPDKRRRSGASAMRNAHRERHVRNAGKAHA